MVSPPFGSALSPPASFELPRQRQKTTRQAGHVLRDPYSLLECLVYSRVRSSRGRQIKRVCAVASPRRRSVLPKNCERNRRMSNTRREAVREGAEVSVVLKEDQGTGRLTRGTVLSVLTNSEYHPRGIKVRLRDGKVGRVEHIHRQPPPTSGTAPPYSAGTPAACGSASMRTRANYSRQWAGSGAGEEFVAPSREAPQLCDWLPQKFLGSTTASTAEGERDEEGVAEEEEPPWSCPACTFLNDSALPRCEMCDTPR